MFGFELAVRVCLSVFVYSVGELFVCWLYNAVRLDCVDNVSFYGCVCGKVCIVAVRCIFIIGEMAATPFRVIEFS